jgi:hypothetical protein
MMEDWLACALRDALRDLSKLEKQGHAIRWDMSCTGYAYAVLEKYDAARAKDSRPDATRGLGVDPESTGKGKG